MSTRLTQQEMAALARAAGFVLAGDREDMDWEVKEWDALVSAQEKLWQRRRGKVWEED